MTGDEKLLREFGRASKLNRVALSNAGGDNR
jgi:hypothetical protein